MNWPRRPWRILKLACALSYETLYQPQVLEALLRFACTHRRLADRKFELLKQNPKHPSLHFKRVQHFWSVRVSLSYRALAIEGPEGPIWFWIGTHDEYDKLLR